MANENMAMGQEMDPIAAQAKTEAQKEVDNLKNLQADFNTKKGIDDAEIADLKNKLIGELFDMLIEVGVDPKDPAAVNDFLMQLEQRDPDLLEIFLRAFESLTGEGIKPETETEEEETDEEAGEEMAEGMTPPATPPMTAPSQPAPAPMEEMAGAAMPMASPKKQFGNIRNAMGMR